MGEAINRAVVGYDVMIKYIYGEVDIRALAKKLVVDAGFDRYNPNRPNADALERASGMDDERIDLTRRLANIILTEIQREFIRQQKANGELPTWEEFVEEHESYWASRTNDNVV